jgi:hypothetical protein
MCDDMDNWDMDYWIQQDQYIIILDKFLERAYNNLQVTFKEYDELEELEYYAKLCEYSEPAYYANYWS